MVPTLHLESKKNMKSNLNRASFLMIKTLEKLKAIAQLAQAVISQLNDKTFISYHYSLSIDEPSIRKL